MCSLQDLHCRRHPSHILTKKAETWRIATPQNTIETAWQHIYNIPEYPSNTLATIKNTLATTKRLDDTPEIAQNTTEATSQHLNYHPEYPRDTLATTKNTLGSASQHTSNQPEQPLLTA